MDVGALVLSGLAVLVSVLSAFLGDQRAKESTRIAQLALDESRTAATNALWSDAVEAVHRLLMDPSRGDIGDRMQDLRITFTHLTDGLPSWGGLDRWLAAEHSLGAVLSREVMLKAPPGSRHTIDQHMKILEPYMEWGMALINNLRHLRNVGYSPDDIEALRLNDWEVIRNVCSRHGWPVPSDPSDA